MIQSSGVMGITRGSSDFYKHTNVAAAAISPHSVRLLFVLGDLGGVSNPLKWCSLIGLAPQLSSLLDIIIVCIK